MKIITADAGLPAKTERGKSSMDTLVSVKNVTKTFPVGKTLLGKPDKFVHAVNNVSFDI